LITSSGVLIEWYDFIVYALLATTLQKAFFPVNDAQVGLILTFATFAIGYFARPLGGLVIGRIGDTRGRRFALLLATTLMLIPLLVITVLPTYERIGILAPLLLILMRLLQGFSVGGEFTGALTTLSEASEDTHRARSVSLGLATATGGVLAASLVVLLTTLTIGAANVEAGGWRIPFALGFVFCLVAVTMQRQLKETTSFEEARTTGEIGRPLTQVLRHYPKQFLAIVALTSWSGITIYTLVTWLPTYLETMVGTSMAVSQLGAVVASAIYVVAIIPIARLSDRFGYRPMMLTAAILYIALTVPAVAMLGMGNIVGIVVAISILGVLQTILDSSATTEMTVLVPTSVRYTAMGVGYSIGAIIGSLTPAIEESAVAATESLWVPAFILIGASVLVIPLIWFIPRLRAPTTAHPGAGPLKPLLGDQA
jgi:MHS family proline/betaine transporter-like MFS transporter